MAFTTLLNIQDIEMTGSNIEVTFPAGFRIFVCYAEGSDISIIDDSANEFELAAGTYMTFEDPNLAGQKINVNGAAGNFQMLSKQGQGC